MIKALIELQTQILTNKKICEFNLSESHIQYIIIFFLCLFVYYWFPFSLHLLIHINHFLLTFSSSPQHNCYNAVLYFISFSQIILFLFVTVSIKIKWKKVFFLIVLFFFCIFFGTGFFLLCLFSINCCPWRYLSVSMYVQSHHFHLQVWLPFLLLLELLQPFTIATKFSFFRQLEYLKG